MTVRTAYPSGDSWQIVCTVPAALSTSETYGNGTWAVAVRDSVNGLSDGYLGVVYAPIAASSFLPLVARVYCTSGCFSGDVLAVEGARLNSSSVSLLPATGGGGASYACETVVASYARLTCVLPSVPELEAGSSVDMRVVVSNEAGSGSQGKIALTQSPTVPRITGVYPGTTVTTPCRVLSSTALQNCSAGRNVIIRSEGWGPDTQYGLSQVVLGTSIGREVDCHWSNANFSVTSGVMFVWCNLPVISWQETMAVSSLAVAAPDLDDTWYWSSAARAAVRYTPLAVPAASQSLNAVTGVDVVNCRSVGNVSYCVDGATVVVNLLRLNSGISVTAPVTAVLANTYAFYCYPFGNNSAYINHFCTLPSIRPVDVGLVLELDIYTTAGRALTSYPPLIVYAASSPYVPTYIPIPSSGGLSSTAAVTTSPTTPTITPTGGRSSSSSSSSTTSTARSTTSSATSSRTAAITSSARSSSSSSSTGSLTRSSTSSQAPTALPVQRSSSSSSSSSRGISSSSSSSSTRIPVVNPTSITSSSSSSSNPLFPITSITSSSSSISSSSSVSSSSSSGGGGPTIDSGESKAGLSSGAVAGIVVLVLVLVLGGVAGGLCWVYGCPGWLRRSRRAGPVSVEDYLNMGDSSMGLSLVDGGGATGGYVPPNYATNAANGAVSGAAASYQPPNAAGRSSQYGGGNDEASNPYLPPSMRSSILPAHQPSSDYVPPGGRYQPPAAAQRSSFFNHNTTVHGSVDNTDGYGGHTADDY